MNGIIITAYPSEADIKAMAPKWAAYRNEQAGTEITPADAETELRDMPVTTFLARHFEARGGKIYEKEERIAEWAKLRWQPDDAEIKAGRKTLADVYTNAEDHEAAYNALKPQRTLADVQGMTLMSFADTAQNPAQKTTLLQSATSDSLDYISTQGSGLSFEMLMKAGAEVTEPTDALALFAAVDPKNHNSYPDFRSTWSWQAGINSSGSAFAYTDDGGADLGWSDPRNSDVYSRARSVLRGTPGFKGLVPPARSDGGDLDTAVGSRLAPDTQAAVEAIKRIPDLRKLYKALKLERPTNGKPLDVDLDSGSFELEIAQQMAAIEDGPLGYKPDLSQLTFPTDPETLKQLKEGIESGALTGTILTAFPGEADLPRLAAALNEQEAKRAAEAKAADEKYQPITHTPESLKKMPVTEFLALHFEARGGILYKKEERLKEWAKLRWQPIAAESKDGRKTLAAVYAAAEDHAAAYDNLKPQSSLGEVLGTAALSFAYTRGEIPADTALIQGDVEADLRIDQQGSGLTFERLINAKASFLSPIEWLSLLRQSSDPKDFKTYPTPYGIDSVNNWEWLSGILPSDSACAYAGDGGANLSWSVPRRSNGYGRARSVLRGAPGF